MGSWKHNLQAEIFNKTLQFTNPEWVYLSFVHSRGACASRLWGDDARWVNSVCRGCGKERLKGQRRRMAGGRSERKKRHIPWQLRQGLDLLEHSIAMFTSWHGSPSSYTGHFQNGSSLPTGSAGLLNRGQQQRAKKHEDM